LHCAEGAVVDVGAGYGTFTLAVARVTWQNVFAIDVDARLLDTLASKAHRDGLNNVTTMLRDVTLEGTGLPDVCADIVLLFNILHYEQPVALFREARRTLRSGRTCRCPALAQRHSNTARPRFTNQSEI
jgi:2-polyprenyl-3-methyl-5-hydroxy-6-metoxy-1,4-benzoquinol methylase